MKLVLNVSCVCGEFDDRPHSFYYDIPEGIMERILHLNKVVKELGVFRILDFNFEPSWHDFIIDDAITQENLEEIIESVTSSASVSVEGILVEVSEESVRFTAVPKHCDEDVLVYTDSVPIELFEKRTVFLDQ